MFKLKLSRRNSIYSLITYIPTPADVVCMLHDHRKHDQLFMTILTAINMTNFHTKYDGVNEGDVLLRIQNSLENFISPP